jgi:hypothetical protein
MHPEHWTISSRNPHLGKPPHKGDLLRQRKDPDRLCMRNTPRALDLSASLRLAISERPANLESFNQLTPKSPAHA